MDDVQYLLSQGSAVEQSFLFIIDSAMRDTHSYPTPSDYYIPFPQPFRNVFAVDLVDATLPRTEYSIDIHNNTLVYAPGNTWTSYEEAFLNDTVVSVALEPGDYNVAQLIEALNATLNLAGLAKDHIPLRVESVGDPVDITNKLRFVRSEPFTLFMNKSSIRKALGFGNPANTPGATRKWDLSARFSTDGMLTNDAFESVVQSGKDPTATYAGPVPVELLQYTLKSSKMRQTFTAATSGLLSSIIIKGIVAAQMTLTVTLTRNDEELESTIVTAVAGTLIWDGVFETSLDILAGEIYALEISSGDTEVTVYKAETFSDDPEAKIEIYRNEEWIVNSTIDALCLDVYVGIAGHSVEAPGQCNLTGERYVLIRSPDIEQHMHRNLAASFDTMAPGLGMLKLGGTGYRDERFNFLAYATRKFHPIGKLRGLTIRLQTQNGRLYDAHGIDHTLLVCVKMYAPGPSTSIPKDLYPEYTPDARKALVKKLEKERC
jgi:hypothetical protein